MNLRIVTASAGTGKTTRLAEILGQAVQDGTARPEAIVATTFTRQAAAELQNRARKRLLGQGQAKAAQAILAARIGTVNSVCGSFVTDFAFELGLSPQLRILDEGAAEIELRRTLGRIVSEEESDELGLYQGKFDREFNWHFEVRRLIDSARANGIDAAGLAACAQRSVRSLDECLGPVAKNGKRIDGALDAAMHSALDDIAKLKDSTKVTTTYVEFLSGARRDLQHGRLRWGDWAKLSKERGSVKTQPMADAVQKVALRHIEHPQLRNDMHALILKIFDVAQRGITAFQDHKHELGVMDYVDQEVLALELLSRDDICEALRGQLDLVLVDEFQDTSPLQLAIFLKLARLAKQSVWVGDPKQAIFGFRGTDPALMDAAIDSLSNPARDPDLVAAAVDALARGAPVETLSKSYRSREELVDVTNAVFEAAFGKSQDMPPSRVRLSSDRGRDPKLGPACAHWPLLDCKNKDQYAAALASGVRDLLQDPPPIWDRGHDKVRPCKAGDVALLCRTNAQCADVAEHLGQLGIDAVVARVGLLGTAEGQVLSAGLALWVDPYDSLAAATLVRVLSFPEDADGFLDFVFAHAPDHGLRSHPLVQGLHEAKQANPDRDVADVVDLVITALDLRKLCAAWGQTAQRIANLDEFRSHAVRYGNEQQAGRDAPSPVGFLAYLDELDSDDKFGPPKSDTCARVGGDDAITVSTWHAAKGLEWPLVVLFGLESLRAPSVYGVHVLSDRKSFDIDDPLGGRWLHFWPNPYTTSGQGGPVKDAYERSDAHAQVVYRGTRESLRVLYVGWTRARDRLVFAAKSGKLLSGILNTLVAIDDSIIHDPISTEAGTLKARWAGHDFPLQIVPCAPGVGSPKPTVPGTVRLGRAPTQHPPARVSPSNSGKHSYTLGKNVVLGRSFKNAGADAAALGSAIHAFLAADSREHELKDRAEMARLLLQRWAVSGAVPPQALVEMGDRFWGWAQTAYPGATLRREWPVALLLSSGTTLMGTADLIIETAKTIAIVDHKSYTTATSAARSEALGGQLAAYAEAVAKANPEHRIETWVHLPLGGVVAQVKVALDRSPLRRP